MTSHSFTLVVFVIIRIVQSKPDTAHAEFEAVENRFHFFVAFGCGVTTGLLCSNAPTLIACCGTGALLALKMDGDSAQNLCIGWTTGILTGCGLKFGYGGVYPSPSESRPLRCSSSGHGEACGFETYDQGHGQEDTRNVIHNGSSSHSIEIVIAEI